MRRIIFGMAVTLIGLIMLEGARAQDKPATPPIWSRLTTARLVIIGQVSAIADKPVEAVLTRDAKEKRNFRVATVKVTELILGPKELKEIKVGFFKDDELKAEQEACFIL